jgi:hypothetical protein
VQQTVWTFDVVGIFTSRVLGFLDEALHNWIIPYALLGFSIDEDRSAISSAN